MHKTNLGVIGYRNHSQKIIKILLKEGEKIIIYCYKKDKFQILFNENKNKNLVYTNNINDLRKCTKIFITSPAKTHYKYIKLFTKKKRYLFCEKPAAINIREINFLNKIDKLIKNKIYFNYN